jgi:hypothetical protein
MLTEELKLVRERTSMGLWLSVSSRAKALSELNFIYWVVPA